MEFDPTERKSSVFASLNPNVEVSGDTDADISADVDEKASISVLMLSQDLTNRNTEDLAM